MNSAVDSAVSPDGKALLTLHGTTNLTSRLWNPDELKIPEPHEFNFPPPTVLAVAGVV